jgi:hypothetical protein
MTQVRWLNLPLKLKVNTPAAAKILSIEDPTAPPKQPWLAMADDHHVQADLQQWFAPPVITGSRA